MNNIYGKKYLHAQALWLKLFGAAQPTTSILVGQTRFWKSKNTKLAVRVLSEYKGFSLFCFNTCRLKILQSQTM